MDIERLKEKKNELGYTYKKIAELSGVPLGTVQKVLGNITERPRRDTYLALCKVLAPEEYEINTDISYIREDTLAYEANRLGKKQGDYTLDDYYALPDEIRAELIDGVIYYMTAPTKAHQLIAGEVHRQLWDCVEKNDSDCIPFIAPLDVQLDKDDRTMVQPDVIMICEESLGEGRAINGAPEFVMEVLSPSTREKDQLIKLSKYKRAGCIEVWIVDPDKRRIMTYDFRNDSWPEIYTFEDHVPLAISSGKCEIDFDKINRMLDKYKLL